jgi:hypothetical protein
MTNQEITIGISVVTVCSGAINLYVGLRLAALQAQIKADAAAAEISLVKQFVQWKDEMLRLLNGKYVSDRLVGEIRLSLDREIAALCVRVDHIEKRCEERPKDCLALRCLLPGEAGDESAAPHPGRP